MHYIQALVSPHNGTQRLEDQCRPKLSQDQWVEVSMFLCDPTGYVNDEFKRVYARPIILRDPKERFLFAHLDKADAKNVSFVVLGCCYKAKTCREQTKTFGTFPEELTTSCHNTHWRPQGWRMETKFLFTLDSIRHMGENLKHSSAKLQGDRTRSFIYIYWIGICY
jgi:hypothetical protein